MSAPRIAISVVSHRQGALARALLLDLERIAEPGCAYALTINVEEPVEPILEGLRLPVTVLRNRAPKGYGANHNAAFAAVAAEHFCVLNPDLRLPSNPFPALLARLADRGVGVVAPRVRSAGGALEDSARRFPTAGRLAAKGLRLLRAAPALDYAESAAAFEPDWVAGMFMMFRRDAYADAGGFDERYFLYYEDVDLCARLRLAGLRVVLEPAAQVVHDARRQSYRSPRYALWHLQSIARWLVSDARRRVTRRSAPA